jgi:hypothetical protein
MVVVKRVRFVRALSFRSFALVWSGQTISSLGDAAFYTAISWQVLLLTGSAAAIGIVVIAQTVPRLLLSLVGGVYADRLSRRLVMLVSDGGRMVAVGALAALGLTGLLQFWHIVALAIFFGVADAFFGPAYLSIPPQLVDVEALPSANSLTAISQQITGLAGPAIAALCITLRGPSVAFAFDAFTFLVSAGTLVLVRVPLLPAHTPDTGTEHPRKPTILQDIVEGFRYVFGKPWLWVSIAVFSVANIGVAPLVVSLPKLVKDTYATGVWLLSASLIIGSVGSLLATALVGQMRSRRHRGFIVYGSGMCAGLALALYGIPAVLAGMHVPLLANAGILAVLVGSALFSAGISVANVLWYTIMQELVPADLLGRVNSIDWLGSFAFLPIGYALAGVLTDRIGSALVFVGGGALLTLLSLAGLSVKEVRALE